MNRDQFFLDLHQKYAKNFPWKYQIMWDVFNLDHEVDPNLFPLKLYLISKRNEKFFMFPSLEGNFKGWNCCLKKDNKTIYFSIIGHEINENKSMQSFKYKGQPIYKIGSQCLVYSRLLVRAKKNLSIQLSDLESDTKENYKQIIAEALQFSFLHQLLIGDFVSNVSFVE